MKVDAPVLSSCMKEKLQVHPLKPFPWATGGRRKKVLTKSNLIQIAFAPKEETLKPFRKNKLTVISFV